ncbi:hypothetical protein SK128_020183, partial [Halocaridina rubra]
VEITFCGTETCKDYERLRPLVYPGTDLVLACYSITAPETLRSLPEKWIPEVRHYLPNVPIILVGSWKELRDDPHTLQKLQEKSQLPVTYEEGQAMAKEIGALSYMECSPRTARGMPELLSAIAREIIKDREANPKESKFRHSCILI